jgi:hypothetical protein
VLKRPLVLNLLVKLLEVLDLDKDSTTFYNQKSPMKALLQRYGSATVKYNASHKHIQTNSASSVYVRCTLILTSQITATGAVYKHIAAPGEGGAIQGNDKQDNSK